MINLLEIAQYFLMFVLAMITAFGIILVISYLVEKDLRRK